MHATEIPAENVTRLAPDYELVIEGSADVVRGPLGRFVDLAEAIENEGGEVPPLIAEAIRLALEAPQ